MSSFNSQLRFPALAAHVQHILKDSSFLEEMPPTQQMNERDDQGIASILSLTSTASTFESSYDVKLLENDDTTNGDDNSNSSDDDNENDDSSLNSRPSAFPTRTECPWELSSTVKTMDPDDMNPILDHVASVMGRSSVSKRFETSRGLNRLTAQETKQKTGKQTSRWSQLRRRATLLASNISTILQDNSAIPRSEDREVRHKWTKETKSNKQHDVCLTASRSLHCRSSRSETKNKPEHDSNTECVLQNDLQSSSHSQDTYTMPSSAHLTLLFTIVNRSVKPSSNAVQDIMSLALMEQECKVLELLEALAEENKQKWSGIRDSLCLHRAQKTRHYSDMSDCDDHDNGIDSSIVTPAGGVALTEKV
ncbi:hypothetical protein BDF22DRAFT_743035 [Syncephalis plumigaleata]|nr:hypothetical protein BDF22DRAFT_743035 [Syncephalis plumigaleata]